MTPRLFKLIAISSGVGGAVVGGYYFVEALTNERIPAIVRNTIEKELKKKGYTTFDLDENGWKKKFEEFRDGDNLNLFAKILKEGKSDDFLVQKSKDNEKGGEELRKWCFEVLDLEIEKAKENKTLENAKLFCVEIKKPEKASREEASAGDSFRIKVVKY